MPSTAELSVQELYVISDLHLGGDAADSQLCSQGDRLAGLVRYVITRTQQATGRVVLILGGDIIDFLITDSSRDPKGYQPYLRSVRDALSFLESVFTNYQAFFDALRKLLQCERAEVVCLLGNHDLELRYSAVWDRLDSRLMDPSIPRTGRLLALHDGDTGYACQVGAAQVLCVHGNAVDPWNEVNYQHLRQVPQEVSMIPPSWEPNPGTALVVDVINALKRSGYAFVDLLKPETKLVGQILLATDRGVINETAWRKVIRRLPALVPRSVRVGGRALRRELRRRFGLLGADPYALNTESGVGQSGKSPRTTSTTAQDAHDKANRTVQLLQQAASDHAHDLGPLDLVSSGEGELGWLKLATDRLRGRAPLDALRDALRDWLAEDQTFALTTRDATFEQLSEWLRGTGRQVDFLIAGHTHLARAIESEDGTYYFNTGTWMQLIRLPPRVLAHAKLFTPIYHALFEKPKPLSQLAKISDLILNRPTVACIVQDESGTRGELCRVDWELAAEGEKKEVRLVSLQEFPFVVSSEEGA